MAGGREWTLEDKSDEYETYQVPTDTGEFRYFRANKVVFEISTPVRVEQVNFGPGDLGKTSGMLTASTANITKTRSTSKGTKFLCTSDRTRKEQTAARYYTRVQVWEMILKAEEYDPETGAKI